MTKFVAFLRGINVGGKNIIKMADLKACFEKNNFQNISTFIQSGNVLFESDPKNIQELENTLEKILSKQFSYKSTILVRSESQINDVVENVPKNWKSRKDLRCYIAFIKEPITAQQVVKEIEVKGLFSNIVNPIFENPGMSIQIYGYSFCDNSQRDSFEKRLDDAISVRSNYVERI